MSSATTNLDPAPPRNTTTSSSSSATLPPPPTTISPPSPLSNITNAATIRNSYYPDFAGIPTDSSPFLHIARQLQLHPFLIEEAAALANATATATITSAPIRKRSPAIATSAPAVRHLGIGSSRGYERSISSGESSSTSSSASPAVSPISAGGGGELEKAYAAYQCAECGRGKPAGRRFCCAEVPVWEVLFRGRLEGPVVRG